MASNTFLGLHHSSLFPGGARSVSNDGEGEIENIFLEHFLQFN